MSDPASTVPGAASEPAGRGIPTVGDRATPGAPPPAANQAKSEPIPPASQPADETGTVGSADPGAHNPDVPGAAHRQTDNEGTAPPGALADDDQLGAERTAPGTPPASIAPPVPTPGDVQGTNAAPSVEAAQGTSEESGKVTGVRATAIAVPGSPDGEVDTRM